MLQGFRIHRVDRTRNKGGGLILLAANDLLSSTEDSMMTDSLELLHVSINGINSKKLQLILIYRPPDSSKNNFLLHLETFLSNANIKNLPYIVFGDFNLDFNKLKKSDDLLQLLNSYSFQNCHNLQTRISKSASTCIDLVFANSLAHNLCNNFLSHDIGVSDHNLITFSYKKNRNIKNSYVYKKQFVYDELSKRNFLNGILDLYASGSFDSLHSFFGSINYYHDYSFTSFNKRFSSNKGRYDFLSPKFHKTANDRDRNLKLYRRSGDIMYLQKFKILRRKASIIAQNDKRDYLSKKINQYHHSDPKKMWNFLSDFFRPNSHTSDIEFIIDNDRCSDKKQIANAFNNHFSNVVSNELTNYYGTSPLPQSLSCDTYSDTTMSFNFHCFNHCDVEFTFKKFRPLSVDVSYLKKSIFNFDTQLFSYIICDIFNRYLARNVFPEELKRACVIPIYKKGSKNNIENYRPISVLPTISKVFEKLLLIQISTHLDKHKLFCDEQFGFSSGNSTESAFLFLLSKIYECCDKNFICSICFLDFTKAFDSVSHEILCNKLNTQFYFSPNACKFIYSYLKNRKQYVSFHSELSTDVFLHYGVPQGGVLSPTLFKLYINDLPNVLSSCNSSIILFADDAVLINFSSNADTLIHQTNHELKNINNYCHRNQLMLNPIKCKAMVVNNHINYNFSNKFVIGSNFIEVVNIYKYLGFYIDDSLKFTNQINYVSQKLACCNNIIARASRFIPRNSLSYIYSAVGLSYVLYFKCVLITTHKTKLQPLYRRLMYSGSIIQNCVKKYVTIDYNLYYLIRYYFYILLFKIFHKNFSHQLHGLVNFTVHEHNTRNKNTLYRSNMKSKFCQRSFKYLAPMMWNSLPRAIREIKSSKEFTNVLSDFLKSQFM